MTLPALLRISRVPLADAPAELLGGAAPPSGFLSYVTQPQLQANWCWAAVSSGVARYYDAATRWTQCRIAEAELGRECCGPEAEGACNIPWFLNRALTRVGHLDRWAAGPVTFAEIVQSIDARDPLCVRIAWVQGGAHFVALYGYGEGTGAGDPTVVSVSDPRYGNSDVPYSEFRDRYRETGEWTHAYLCA